MSSYKIPFASLSGNKYELRIYPSAEGYSASSAQVLHGGREVFVTDEGSGTDIFHSVRSSTGHINIVTDDYSLQENIMPTTSDGMRVTLIRHARADEIAQLDTVAWEGYIRPETFSQEWGAGPWEIQLPVVSRLGMIMDDYLSDGNTGLLTVREWLARICGNVYKYVLIPNDELSSQGTMPWGNNTLPTPTVLQLAFSEELFKTPISLPEREDPTDTTQGLWDPGTNADIAASLCTAFRWVLREDGDTLICSDPGTKAATYLRYTVESLHNESPISVEMVPIEQLDISELGERWTDTQIGGDDGTKEVLLPFGRVSLKGASGRYDTLLINATNEDWQKTAGIPYVNGAPGTMNRPDTVPFELYGDSSVTIKSQKVLDNAELESFRYTSGSVYISYSDGTTLRMDAGVRMDRSNDANKGRILGDTSMIYGNTFPSVIFGLPTNELKPGDRFGGGEISAIHYFYERNETYVHYRLNSIILGHLPFSAINKPAIKLRTTLAQLLPYSSRQKGYISLCLSGTVHRGRYYNNIDMPDSCDGDGFYGIQVSIKMGDLYLYKDTWGSHQCSLTTTEAPFDILWTKDNNDQFKEYVRLGMTDTKPMALDTPVEITIYTPSDATRDTNKVLVNNCKYLRIDNFQVTVMEQEDDDAYDFSETLVAEPDSGISINKRIGTNKLEELTLNTSLGGVDNPGALFSAIPVVIDGASMRTMQARKVGVLEGDNDGARYLCKRTFDWAVLQGRSTRHAIKIPLRTERPWSLPEPAFVGCEDRTYYPAAKSRSWRDDKTTLTLIEVKYE